MRVANVRFYPHNRPEDFYYRDNITFEEAQAEIARNSARDNTRWNASAEWFSIYDQPAEWSAFMNNVRNSVNNANEP